MKTILYNPIFINPQAYYVFPRLTRYLQPDNESTAEPANYIGTIEVKVIAYGDTTLKRTYTNTDSIDLSEFKNTWIRISLFTKVGSCVLGEWKIGNMESDLPYIDPEVLASLKAVVIVGNKTNNDSDRAIVKNLVDPDNPFVISNAAYDKMSSYGGYEFAKFDNTLDWYNTEGNDSVEVVSRNGHSITLKRLTGPNFWYFQNSTFRGLISNVIPFKVNSNKNITVIWDVHGLSISEGKDKSVRIQELVLNPNEDNYTNLKTLNEEELAQIDISTNSLYYLLWFDLSTLAVDEEVTIEMLPLFEGAFVTDGIDDLITSTKTVQEMLGGSNEITVVSLITHISGTGKYNIIGDGGIQVSDYSGQTFMAGTSSSGEKIVELGDKEKLQAVQYTTFDSKLTIGLEDSSYAYYGTFVFNKENVPVDWIHQVIAYFNLDRTLKPDILCDVKKQGITNENHAEFGDKLIDFSGNGRDIQLNNLAWDGDSGIGKYNYPNWKVTATIANTYSTIVNYPTVNGTYSINVNGVSELMQSIGLHLEIKYTTSTGIIYNDIKQDGVYSYILPDGATDLTLRFGGIPGIVNEPCNITITQIPSHAGALCLDGVNDFGKVTGMPVYKDYTFIIDYERISYASSERWVAGVVSKSHVANQGAFILMTANTTVEPGKQAYSFGGVTSFNRDDFTRALVYQSKYKCGDVDLTVGEGVDSNTLWLGTFRDNDQRFFNGAIYSLMSFPYSMSEFLIERQLKKYKLGTLYPNMVEFRPVIKANDNYKIFYTAMLPLTGDIWERINIGDYVPVGRRIAIQMSFDNEAKKLVSAVSSQLGNITIVKNSNNIGYTIFGDVLKDKSPQKISITIEQDENYVLFNPVINSNYKYISLDFFLNNYQKKINIGDYIPKDAYLRANLYLNNNVDEPAEFTFNGVSIGYSRSITVDTAFNIGHIYNYDSPQEVNITIDEYIRYEDIVQPYPVLLRFNDESGKEVSWGGKFRVGSTITRIGSAADSNLLPNIYNIFGLLLNDNQVTSSKVIVEKTMVFKAKSAYIFDNNEPKCILSPSRLRIPNSSYKLLGYIPDISGHGNHGKINNSAYASMSGANGYPYDYNNSSFWCDSVLAKVVSGELIEYFAVKNSTGFSNITSGVYKGEIKVTGVTKAISENKISLLRIFTNSTTDKEIIDITQDGNYNIDIKGVGDANRVFFYAIPNNPNESIVVRLTEPIHIEQVGEYEGAYCLDGVDDFVTIPTATGGKQVFMKVNWDKTIADAILYDQRGYPNEFAIYNADNDNSGNPVFAYQARNNGQTYIDGILNKNIKASELRAITHNITITNELQAGVNQSYAVIGSNRVNDAYFTKMALYDFMLFDEISTDDKIKELNEYVGIEGNT